MDIDTLMRLARDKGGAFRERFYSEILRMAVPWIRSRVHNHHDVQDVLQEYCLRVCRGALERCEGNIRAFLYGIASHTIADFYRKRGRHAVEQELGDEVERLPAEDRGAEAHIAEFMLARQLEEYVVECVNRGLLLPRVLQVYKLLNAEVSVNDIIKTLPDSESTIRNDMKCLSELALRCCQTMEVPDVDCQR